MRIILSRKGFDSSYGGVASPIFPDGRLCSLPIADASSGIRYAQLDFDGINLGTVVEALTHRRIRRVSADDQAHLDPDLNPSVLPRDAGWRGLFGQTAGSQSHLAGHGVGIGGLFLFFGWFRRVTDIAKGPLTYVPHEPDLHVLFGWLQVGLVVNVAGLPPHQLPWARYHPHFRHTRSAADTLYIASEHLNLPGITVPLPGAGVFPRYSPALRLTAPGSPRRTHWRLPRWFYPADAAHALSHHSDLTRWQITDDCTYLRAACRGQESVLDCGHYPQVTDWLADLFAEARNRNESPGSGRGERW